MDDALWVGVLPERGQLLTRMGLDAPTVVILKNFRLEGFRRLAVPTLASLARPPLPAADNSLPSALGSVFLCPDALNIRSLKLYAVDSNRREACSTSLVRRPLLQNPRIKGKRPRVSSRWLVARWTVVAGKESLESTRWAVAR